MKSIYEASVAYGREHQGTVNIEDYQAGANYVLEQIEEFQKLFSTCMNAHANGYLKSVIEQLKR